MVRPRRLRTSTPMRRLVAEHRLHASDLVLPAFVREGIAEPVEVASMPGVLQHTVSTLVDLARECVAAGLGGIMLFGVPEDKDAVGSGADDPDGILNVATRAVVDAVGDDLVVMTDLCLDEFTDHGHCGVLRENAAGATVVDNDATLERYADMAIAQARAGSHVLGLSGMMDGQVAFVRGALDREGFTDTAILAYSAKYTSALYGPFREAVCSSLTGDRATYQQDPANATEAVRELELDIAEGADIVMVKPAGPHLDVVAAAAQLSTVPVAAYQISGEYAQIVAAAERGWIDRDQAALESVLHIRRAGAGIILSYFALELAARTAQRGEVRW
ncbi:porphobilinogen synthase [Marihabitans asiaticum]|uniref:Delta-aminolevulinic acid dehydratase n=1 Tax=Marihabitans asiaticum TaxID=415218 RepID=A0A560WDM6_9MICO|nr:porphobilinogen synthase [Marihabitans asiaticum]TWD15634.1 porphobilinogen synthase [Marihabitans asiaticum]